MKSRNKLIVSVLGCVLVVAIASVSVGIVVNIQPKIPFGKFPEQAPNLVLKGNLSQDNGTQVLNFLVEQTIDHQRPFYEYKMNSVSGGAVQYQAILGQQFIFGLGEFQQKQKVEAEQLAVMQNNSDAQIINDYFFAEVDSELAIYDEIEYIGKEFVLGRVTYRFYASYEKEQQISRTQFSKEMWVDEQTGVTLKAIETTDFELQDTTQPLSTHFQKTFEVNQLTINEITS